jgi:hypothetical protein
MAESAGHYADIGKIGKIRRLTLPAAWSVSQSTCFSFPFSVVAFPFGYAGLSSAVPFCLYPYFLGHP